MGRPRIIRFVNVTNPDAVGNCLAVRKACATLNYLLALIANHDDRDKYVPIEYLYCEPQRCFIRLMGIDDVIIVEQIDTTLEEFDIIYEHYRKYFLEFDPTTFQSFETGQLHLFREAWKSMFEFFIRPLHFLKGNEKIHVLIFFNVQRQNIYLLDLATIFDLQFRFEQLSQNVPYYILSVAGTDLVTLTENLLSLSRPTFNKCIILNGFYQYYSTRSFENFSPEVKRMALAREELYKKLFQNVQQTGAQVVELTDRNVLLRYLQKEWNGHLLHILSHFEIIDEMEQRLYLRKQSIRQDVWQHLIDRLQQEDLLRTDIVLDAITCANFFNFRNLYARGFRYLHLSHHNIDTDLAAFTINELYTGVNAGRLGWANQYFNGNSYLHEARSNVARCFFLISNTGQHIYIP